MGFFFQFCNLSFCSFCKGFVGIISQEIFVGGNVIVGFSVILSGVFMVVKFCVVFGFKICNIVVGDIGEDFVRVMIQIQVIVFFKIGDVGCVLIGVVLCFFD